MKISIITPSFNQVEFIERTIISVLNQNIPQLEYIIIDGESSDGTLKILEKYSSQLKWKSEKDNGQSEAINKGLKMATGDIVAFLNSDDTYEPHSLEKVLDFFQANQKTKWVYGKCRIVNDKDTEIRKPITWYKNMMLKNYSFSKLLRENFISQPATFWRRELIDEVGLFNENEHYCMDYEYWLRIGSRYKAGIINSYLANFRYYSRSKSGSDKNYLKQFQDELGLAKKFGKDHPISILIHKFNYYKITWIYWLLSLKK